MILYDCLFFWSSSSHTVMSHSISEDRGILPSNASLFSGSCRVMLSYDSLFFSISSSHTIMILSIFMSSLSYAVKFLSFSGVMSCYHMVLYYSGLRRVILSWFSLFHELGESFYHGTLFFMNSSNHAIIWFYAFQELVESC